MLSGTQPGNVFKPYTVQHEMRSHRPGIQPVENETVRYSYNKII